MFYLCNMFNYCSIVEMINEGIRPYHLREAEVLVEEMPLVEEALVMEITKSKKPRRMSRPYYKLVWEITNINALNLDGIELRGWKGKHVEHIVPISYGERHNIPAELIGSLDNIVMMDRSDNMKKGCKLTEASKELLKLWGYELS
jgi:hypothetical protein